MPALQKMSLFLASLLLGFSVQGATVFWLESKGAKKALSYWQARYPVKAGLLIVQKDTALEGNLCLKNLARQFPARDISVVYYPLSSGADKAASQAEIALLLNRMQEVLKTPNLYVLYYGRGVEHIAPVLQEQNKRYKAAKQSVLPAAQQVQVLGAPGQANPTQAAQNTKVSKEALIRGIIYLSALDTSPPEPKSLGLQDLNIPLLDVGAQFDFATVQQQIESRNDLYLNSHTYRKLDVSGVGHDYCYQADSLASYLAGWMSKVAQFIRQAPTFKNS